MASLWDGVSTENHDTKVESTKCLSLFPSIWRAEFTDDVLILRFPKNFTTEEHLKFVDACSSWILSQRKAWSICMDLSDYDAIQNSNATRRKLFAEALTRHAQSLNEYCKGVSLVSQSSIARGLATAVLWFFQSEFQTEIFSSRTQALNWCRSQLRA